MFENLVTRINTRLCLATANAMTTRDRMFAQLNTRMAQPVNLQSDEGIDDAVWKIAVIALVALLASGVLTTLYNKTRAAGENAANALDGVPGFGGQ